MLIKCPECGHEVSSQAPVCPHCGIEIAGRYSVPTTTNSQAPIPTQPQKKKSRTAIYIFSVLFAMAVCGVVYYFYHQAKVDEKAQYDIAIHSDNKDVLQGFLYTYHDAPREHRDSVQTLLTAMNSMEREWNDAVVSNTRAALQHYIDEHPGSKYEKMALSRIDSLDWMSAQSAGTPEAMKSYAERHPDGRFLDEAAEMARDLNAQMVQPEEKQMINSIFRQFFQSVNAKDENRLTNTVNSLLTMFLGKSDATKSDVVTFMKKLWKDDVMNLNWHIIDDYRIDKKEVGDGEYEFSVTFTATQEVQKATGMTTNKFRIKAKVNPDGKISEMNMSKVLE